jgi:hypothetical protein
VILSVVDAEDMYLSAKALTVTMMNELEAKWHEPALKKLEKMMQAMSKGQAAQPPIQPDMEEDYADNQL